MCQLQLLLLVILLATVLASHNVIDLEYFMRISYGVNNKALTLGLSSNKRIENYKLFLFFLGFFFVGNEEKHLRWKILLSWRNILNSRQIATGIEEKQVNQGEVLRGEESVVFTFPYQTNGNHAKELSTIG